MPDELHNPLRDLHAEAANAMLPRQPLADDSQRPGAATGQRIAAPGVDYLTYGPPLAGEIPIEVPATYGSVELEYAALRRGCGIMDCPQRGTLRTSGSERIDFLNRMVTQQLKNMQVGDCRCAFWLNRKGRIEADMLLLETDHAMLIDIDRHDVDHTVESLTSYIFAEDVQMEDVGTQYHRLSLHGPQARSVLFAAAKEPDAEAAHQRNELQGGSVTIDDAEIWFVQRALTSEDCIELFIPIEAAQRVWRALLAVDAQMDFPVRPLGWFAFNIARIEYGMPIMHIDFNQEHLPHESGLLRERVSFTKGCYLGQEIVARMESRGKPKQIVVSIKVQGERQPLEGAQMFESSEDEGTFTTPIGGVTSSAISPMLGGVPVCLAIVRSKFAVPGTKLVVLAEGEATAALVTERPMHATADAADATRATQS